MSRAQGPALDGARAQIAEVAAAFAQAAAPIVADALRRRLEGLRRSRQDRFGSLRPEVTRAFEDAAARAIAQGAEGVGARLRDEDLWLDPLTAPGVAPAAERGWDGVLPEWVSGILRRFGRPASSDPALGDLDDPGNRIWVALLGAARALDPVLEEFGLAPSPAPDLGGGHYGLQPKTAAGLDPGGTLERLWERYRAAYERYSSLRAATDGHRA